MLSTVANNFAILDKAYVASLSRALEIVVRYKHANSIGLLGWQM